MYKKEEGMSFILAMVLWASPLFAGSCQDVGGTVRCTDETGRDASLQSLDKALGSPGAYTPPQNSPDALKSYPSDVKPQDGSRHAGDPNLQPGTDAPKTTLQAPGLTKGTR